jgi:hypothetical protein
MMPNGQLRFEMDSDNFLKMDTSQSLVNQFLLKMSVNSQVELSLMNRVATDEGEEK